MATEALRSLQARSLSVDALSGLLNEVCGGETVDSQTIIRLMHEFESLALVEPVAHDA
ncbi:hypothetical protein [Methylococcus sp. EFPC2]|uniref:hypothetical protein n=1 Tax=Methylococcus sp. EFPC2 TaxID=2812648 RepID=UPI00353034C8